jgi:hypothetical protein
LGVHWLLQCDEEIGSFEAETMSFSMDKETIALPTMLEHVTFLVLHVQ